MKKHLGTLAVCVALGLTTWAQASSQAAKQSKTAPAKHAQKAQKVKITHGPVIESARPTTATIAWSTNVNASTILQYGTNPNHLTERAEKHWGGVTHRVQLHNLKPGTTYYYRVESTQALGTGSQAISGVEQFRTQGANTAAATPAAKPANVKVTHGPVVEGENATSATIAWSTNVKASTILKYGTNPNTLNQTAEAPWGGLTHRVHLRGLKPGATYYYRVESTQAQGTGTQALSGLEQFQTKPAASPAAAAARPAKPAPSKGEQTALRNFHQFLVTHPNIKTDLQKDPYLAKNGHYVTTHPGFSQFLQTHPGVRQYLAQNPKAFMQGEAVMR